MFTFIIKKMKIDSLLFSLVLILQFLSLNTMSQTLQANTVKLDTINVSGKITSGDGNPMANITIVSTSQDIHYIGVKANTTTDLSGNFVLKGIKPIDTISFFALGSDYTFINNGSRHLNIIISPKIYKLNPPDNPATVTATGSTKSGARDFELRADSTLGAIYQRAKYPGGLMKFIRYISRNTKYPDNSRGNGIEGTVTVEFIISKMGGITSAKIINGLDKYCDQAVLNALYDSPRWTPTIVRGKPVETTFQLDVVFKISGPIHIYLCP
jgi:TonB family protein